MFQLKKFRFLSQERRGSGFKLAGDGTLSSGVGLGRREDKVEISDPVKSHGSRR